jgi:tetratricopeptide (TPR) repeat protein/Mg-chelatase subunit ChlD
MPWRTLILGIALLSMLAACGGTPPPAPKAVPPLGSRIDLAAGDVWLKTEGGRERLITGAMLPEQASLELAPGARALVRMGNGTALFLKGGTGLAIERDVVTVASGEVWVDVPADERDLGRFVAGTTTVTAAGAGFDLAVAGDEVRVYVARGLAVVAAAGGRAEVPSGERAVVKGGAAPKVSPVGYWEDWTGGMADRAADAGVGGRAAGRIYGIDLRNPGRAPSELQIVSQEVRAVIRDGIAHTTVDQRFFNPTSVEVEGWYWFTIPEGAAVERFALEVNGVLVDGEMIERVQAREAYEEAIRRAFDPALLEWVDGRTFRARIFPIPATGERRVVLSYLQFLPLAGGACRYVYPMGGEREQRIQEFSLRVDLGEDGKDFEIATLQDARVEEDSSAVTMRRSGFVPRSDFLLELRPAKKTDPVRAARFSSGYDEADYVMLRWAPEVDWSAAGEVKGDVVLVVDTSAGGGEAERQLRSDVAEAVLRALSAGDRFAVVAADLFPRVVYPEQGLAPADDAHVSAAMERLSAVSAAGATDLGEMFTVALELVHESEQPALAYIGDGRPTVGEMTAVELSERLRRSLGESRARLFAIGVGADANHGLLDRLAMVGGGRAFRIDTPEQAVQEALRFAGTVKTPTITDLEVDAGAGLDQVFSSVAGKVSEGQEVVILARTHHRLPDKVGVRGRLGGKPFEKSYPVKVEKGAEHGYLPFLWARAYLERLMGEGLEPNRGSIISLGLTYALMTPLTSFLVLESDYAYAEQGIRRRQRLHLWAGFDGNRGVATSGPMAIQLGAASGSVTDEEGSYPAEPMPAMESVEMERPSSWGRDRATKTEAPAPAMDADYAPRPAAPPPSPRPAPSGGGGRAAPSTRTAADTSGLVGQPAKTKKASAKEDRSGGGLDDLVAGLALVVEPSRNATTGPLFETRPCSDASRRPLSQRRVLWQRRLDEAGSPAGWTGVFFDAGARCELPQWQHQQALLEMIEARATSADQVRALLNGFASHPKLRKLLQRRIVRRTLDPDLLYGIYSWSGPDWHTVRRGLAAIEKPEKRLEELRKVLERFPEDPVGQGLLIEVLLDLGDVEQARQVATRLRRDELAGPLVLGTLCDLQAEVGLEADARRTCSELVEFNAMDPAARRRLGDLFLRHGWYDAAYRQYRTLAEMSADDPSGLLRLAAAAAGMGRVDEALRVERKVAAGDGEPGPTDPRRWARLLSSVRLARMILAAREAGDQEQAGTLERALKRSGGFTEPVRFVLLVWEDLESPLRLVVEQGGKPFTAADRIDAPGVGLAMVDLGRARFAEVQLSLELAVPPVRRALPLSLVTIEFDGEKFELAEKKLQLPARAAKARIER